jgi:hypothetical protein
MGPVSATVLVVVTPAATGRLGVARFVSLMSMATTVGFSLAHHGDAGQKVI